MTISNRDNDDFDDSEPESAENPRRYISCDVLCFGDYGGAGSVGRANIDALKDRPGAWVENGAYWSEMLWLPITEENKEIVTELDEQYPLFDEEAHSEVEMRWEEEAWKDCYKQDLLRLIAKDDSALSILFDTDSFDADTLWQLYIESMDECNRYPTMEYSGASIPIDGIKDAFAHKCRFAAHCQIVDAVQGGPFAGYATMPREEWPIVADWLIDHGEDVLAEYLRELASQASEV